MSQYLDKDGASRIAENFLSKQAEQDVILANLQFDIKEAEHALVKTIQGPAPLNIRALTRPFDDYLISGNTLQDGTPTPEAPVDVQGVGVKTENLFYGFDSYGVVPSINGGSNANYLSGASTDYIKVDNPLITLSKDKSFKNARIYIFLYDDNKTFIGYALSDTTKITSLDISNYTSAKFARIRVDGYYQYAEQYMLNTGSTAKPYVPYGYKLPPTVNGTEYPIYLGQVPTTRRIKNLVLTGEEDWSEDSAGDSKFFRISLAGATGGGSVGGIMCSHFVNVEIFTSNTAIGIWLTGGGVLRVRPSGVSSISKDDFTAWLASEYSAGHPVTVWYVLAEPETGIVNEPLHKIGDYADTISYAQSGVEISTTKGFNTITTDTTVLPSNIEVKGVINNA